MKYIVKSKKSTKAVYEYPDKLREGKNKIKGGNADNMTLEDIAKYHKVPLDNLLVEFKLGKIVEREHTDDPEGIEEIALDHIYDNPHYYTEGKDKGIFEELENVDIGDIKKNLKKGNIQKSKYIKRWRGKNNKWHYLYKTNKKTETEPKPLTQKEEERWQELRNNFAKWDGKKGGYFGARELTQEEKKEKEYYSEKHHKYYDMIKNKKKEKEIREKNEELKREERLKKERENRKKVEGIPTYKDFLTRIDDSLYEWINKYDYIGLRFDEKDYEPGDVIPDSRSNIDRENEREFPEYGTKEYKKLPKLDGVSSYGLYVDGNKTNRDVIVKNIGMPYYKKYSDDYHVGKTVCIIGSNSVGSSYNEDYNEIVLKKPVVLDVIYRDGKLVYDETLNKKNKNINKSKKLEEFEKAKKDPELENKIKKVMEEFKSGTLKDSHGNIVKDRKQALAIAYSQYRSGVVEKSELEELGQTPVEWDHKYNLMGKLRWKGLKIGIENKKGSIRKGTDPDGKPWEVKMNCPYGRITGTKGTDNNNVDVYVGPNRESDRVFVIHQNNPWTGAYDEDKVMIGFDDGDSAKSAYISQYNRPDFFGSMDEMTVDELKKTMKACRGSMLRKHPDNMQKSLTEEDMLKINEFLRETEGKIEDEELHEFAEKNGLNTKRVEEYIYLLAQEYLDEEEGEE